jgi:hypothetical protein
MPLDRPRFAHQMKVPAGIRKTGPWVVCLSGLRDPQTDNQYMLDRQGHLSVFHARHGLIVTGAGSRGQPELATFVEKTKDGVAHLPVSTRLRMSDKEDRQGLAYHTFFAEVRAAPPTERRLAVRVVVTETGKDRLQEAQLTLQLCLKTGKVLGTAKTKAVLDGRRVELGPDELGGVIRHAGWSITVPAEARLTWPVYPYNPYRNGPETELRHAVAVLHVPVRVQAPHAPTLPWRSQEMTFVVESLAP